MAKKDAVKDEVKLERLKPTKYEYDYVLANGFREHYEWRPAKNGYRSIISVPLYIFEDMKYNSCTLSKGKLVVVEDVEKEEEVMQIVDDVELYEERKYGFEKAKELLEGDAKKLKAELEKIKDQDTYRLFVTVAKEIKLDSTSKLKLLSQYVGVPVDVLFEQEI